MGNVMKRMVGIVLPADSDWKTAQMMMSRLIQDADMTLDGCLVIRKSQREDGGVVLTFYDVYDIETLTAGKRIRHFLRKLKAAVTFNSEYRYTLPLKFPTKRNLSFMYITQPGR